MDNEKAYIPKIKIKTNGISTKLSIDGNEIKGVRGIFFSHAAPGVPQIDISIIAADIEIDGLLIPELPDIFKPFYKKIEPPEDGSQGL